MNSRLMTLSVCASALVLMSSCGAGRYASKDELAMTTHPLAQSAPAIYLERTGNLVVYDGVDNSEKKMNERAVGKEGFSSYSYLAVWRLKVFDPAALGAALRQPLPAGFTPEDLVVHSVAPDATDSVLAATVEGEELVIPTSNIAPGSVVHVEFAIRGTDFEKVPSWAFQGPFPTLLSQYRVRAHYTRKVFYNAVDSAIVHLSPPAVVEGKDALGVQSRLSTWKVTDLNASSAGAQSAALVVTKISPRQVEVMRDDGYRAGRSL